MDEYTHEDKADPIIEAGQRVAKVASALALQYEAEYGYMPPNPPRMDFHHGVDSTTVVISYDRPA